MGFIYKITNNINGKVYIGQTINPDYRWYKHKYLAQRGSKRHLYSAMRHYGIDNFSFEIIEECGDELLDERERYWINITHSTDSSVGYNKTFGGEGGNTWILNNHKEDTSRLLSKKLKGHRVNLNAIHMMAESRRGSTLSEEQKNKISESLREGYRTGRIKANPPPHFDRTGCHQPESAKQKISQSRLGKSYEEIYGTERACAIKEKRRQNWIGQGNPNYKDVNADDIIQLIKAGYQNKQIAAMLGISTTTIWSKLKETGITASEIRLNEGSHS